jgi:hypothetical protein
MLSGSERDLPAAQPFVGDHRPGSGRPERREDALRAIRLPSAAGRRHPGHPRRHGAGRAGQRANYAPRRAELLGPPCHNPNPPPPLVASPEIMIRPVAA